MAYEILPHTADVGIAGTGGTLAEAFSETVRGLGALLLDAEPPPGTEDVPVALEAGDRAALLAAVLEEAIYRFDVEGVVPVGGELVIEEGEESVRASGRLRVVRGVEPRGPAVKAVTYHAIEVSPRDGGWRTQVYLDV